jgi:TonB-dependent Receptor Plug Domain
MNIRCLIRTLCLALAFFMSVPAHAVGEATGNIIGSLQNQSDGSYVVNATDTSTGRSRDVSVDASGAFRFSQLPVGVYTVSVTEDGRVVAQDLFNVSLNGNTIARFTLSDSTVEEIVVTASAVTGDVYSTDSGLVLGEAQIDMMPVGRNLTSVALLAPGVVLGDSKFDLNGGPGYASFGGSSIAENSCYINGLEVTNTRQGLGCGAVPFEFYDQFQVKTGGYSSQYGRTTGGVLNAVTKSGGNEWEFGVGLAIEPGSLYEEGKVSRGGGGLGGGVGGPGTGRVFRDTTQDENDLFEYWVTASGPIIEDKLFIYAIVNPRDSNQDFSWQTSARQQYARDDEFRRIESKGADNLFWGAKIDWDVTDYHRLSAFGYSNRNDGTDVHYAKDPVTNAISNTPNQTIIRKRGGEAHSLSYQGTFFEDFTLSAMVGTIKTEYTSDPDDTVTCPSVADNRSPAPTNPISGCGPGGQFGNNFDENTQTRLDLEWNVGDHLVRVGLDKQDRDSTRLSVPIGGHNWTYATLAPNGTIQGNSGPIYTNNTGAPQEFVFDRIFSNEAGGGGFKSELTAYYLEDEWQLNDNFVLYLGIRKDQLTNIGSTGVVFADFDQDWAPRLGLSWDPTGSGQNKIYSTWGRYYLPIPNNTNFRVASGVNDTTTYYTYTGVDAATGQPTGFTPITGNQGTSTVINSVATAPTKDQFQAQEADPFYKDEFIAGYERLLNDEYSASIRFVFREVGATLDDYCGAVSNPSFCTLVNPGFSGSWSATAGGPIVTYDAATIGLPKGRNEYTSVQTEFKHQGDRLNYAFLYTWGRSVGNFEGAVKSDIVQVDAGITTDFDFPALMDGADGYLPNDRRHVFKFYGSYQVTDNLTAGWNASLASGRPQSAFGSGYPDTSPAVFGSYGDTYYLYTNQCPDTNNNGICEQSEKIYQFTGRGNAGRTPWTTTLDASLTYNFEVSNVEMSANLQIFNLLDIQEITSINEHAEARRSEGNPNEWYGAAYAWQQPRHVRLSIQARF